ncbi:MAG: flagellar basal body rod C-terminal domain-containing protein, partial [Syntrophomonadaceae bacterium]|nr:flagellar basal body rod C-terminal domain-containing protein [Syntrophomonadaceae bacterium]
FNVTQNIIDDPKNIAAASEATWDALGNKVNFGDGGIALQIARLKHLGYTGGDASLIQFVTVDDYWRSVCAFIGVDSQEASRMARNQDTLLGELENKRQSLSGVSLDEEMTNMIKFQHAYNAASRFITTIDEQIDVIVNRMGLVGR